MKGEGVKSRKITQEGQKDDTIWPPKSHGSISSRPHFLGPFFLNPRPSHPPTHHVQPEVEPEERTSRAKSESVHLSSHVQGINILRPRQRRRSTLRPQLRSMIATTNSALE